jgi:predicted permease
VTSAQANFFDVLGVSPLRGRTFARGEDTAGKNRIAVLSYGFWQRHFGAAANIVGKTMVLNEQTYTVIGVMPRWFNFQAATDVWIPLDMSRKELGPHGNHRWQAVGRLRAGVTLAQARQDLLSISKRLEKQYPDTNNKVHAVLIPLKETLTGDSKAPLLILLAAVVLVLLIACVNVANLQLARASTRHREMAVRSSLGAGRLRLVRQMLTESILLALAGAAAGVLAAAWPLHLLQAVKSLPIPRANPIQVDGTVLLVAVGLSVLAGVLFGLAPALQNSEPGLNEELKAGSQSVLNVAHGRRMLRDGLVVAEISLTLALLVGAGLLLRSFARLRGADIGIKTQNVVTASLNLPETKYPGLSARRQFFDQLAERTRNSPGVASAAISTEIPLEGGSNGYIKVDGESDPALSSQLVGWNFITPGYFRTLSIPLLEGRNFTEQDLNRAGVTGQKLFDLYKAAQGSQVKAPPDLSFVAIISQTMAKTFWRNQNPVGRSFHWNDSKVVVVGVVGDVKEYGIRAQAMPQAYLPLPLALPGFGFGYLTVKALIPSAAAISTMRNQVRALDPNLALLRPQTMHEVVAANTHDATIQTFLLGTFAILALILAAIGLYGVMSYLVGRRTREIGVRMALGARQANVLRLILMEGTKLTLVGMLVGTIAALALTRWMSSLLYGVGPEDPLAFTSAAAILAVIALAAYYIPARRATKIDPVVALRYE